MTALFADTFYWIALSDSRDDAHRRAIALTSERASSPIITTDEVLIEYLTFFAETERYRIEAAESVRELLDTRVIRVIPQSRESFLAGLDLYAARPDKGYSLTDCISMAVMRREGVTEVLTNDLHFEQEGFRTLFRNT